MPTSFLLKLSIVALICWRTMPAMAQEHYKEHTPTEMNKQFQDPKLDVQKFVQRFESESRDIFAQRRQIVEAVGLRSGMAVADIGAGTGLFTWLFAKKVGTTGTVYAVEIAPAFLKYLEEESRKRGLDKVVKTVQSSQTRTNLAAGSIDVAFVCATYHHFEHPEKVLRSIHQALRPGGQLVVIDFDLRDDSSAFVRERARAPKEVYFREIEAAGFTHLEAKHSVHLKDNFIAVFQRREPGTDRRSDSR